MYYSYFLKILKHFLSFKIIKLWKYLSLKFSEKKNNNNNNYKAQSKVGSDSRTLSLPCPHHSGHKFSFLFGYSESECCQFLIFLFTWRNNMMGFSIALLVALTNCTHVCGCELLSLYAFKKNCHQHRMIDWISQSY